MNTVKDYLEELMDLKRSVLIRFRSIEGSLTEIKGRIAKLTEVSGRLIVETDTGYVIGNDQIIEINGRRFENIC